MVRGEAFGMNDSRKDFVSAFPRPSVEGSVIRLRRRVTAVSTNAACHREGQSWLGRCTMSSSY